MMMVPRAPFRGGMPPHPYMNPMQGRPPMGPMMRGGPQMRQGGGLLSKILGKGSQTSGMAGIQAANRAAGSAGSGGGILQSLSNPSAINGFLTNSQKVLNTAQQFGPMVQQYGPLVKNLPAMWKLYRGIKDAPEDSTSQDNNESTNQTKTVKMPSKKKTQITNDTDVKRDNTRNEYKGISKPKLYI